MKILNLGCGTKISSSPDVTNIDWTVFLRMKRSRVLRLFVPLVVTGERLKRFNTLSDNVVVHNLAKGLPYDADSVDVVYHSHLLEHLDKEIARLFLLEIKRVLKPGGIVRIVVPDMEKAARDYISHISMCQGDSDEANRHDAYIATMIEQSVRREASGTSQQKPARRFVENALLGDARKRGETHQWMYDSINLGVLLVGLGYSNVQRQSFDKSLVAGWNQYGLDLDERGNEYKPESLYMEAQK